MQKLLPVPALMLLLPAEDWTRHRLLHAAEVHPFQPVLDANPARVKVERPVGKDVLQLKRRFPRDVEGSCEEICVVGWRDAEGGVVVLRADGGQGNM